MTNKKNGWHNTVAVIIRLPRDMVEKIDAFAATTFRSRSAFIKSRIYESMQHESIDIRGVIVRHDPTPGK